MEVFFLADSLSEFSLLDPNALCCLSIEKIQVWPWKKTGKITHSGHVKDLK